MPTAVTYEDNKTITKVMKALAGQDDLDFAAVLSAVERLQSAGILFREEVPDSLRPKRRNPSDLDGEKSPDGAVDPRTSDSETQIAAIPVTVTQ